MWENLNDTRPSRKFCKNSQQQKCCVRVYIQCPLKNESLHNSIAHLCPKSKHLSSTNTLLTRVEVVVCCANMGAGKYYTKMVETLTETPHPSPDSFNRFGGKRKSDKLRQNKREFKCARRFKTNARWQEDIYKQRFTDKKGTYAPGVRFNLK